jgi:hypothetical protein
MMYLFANSDDTLLEGDLGDDVDYDLGNEDEDALLADDYDVEVSVTSDDIYCTVLICRDTCVKRWKD